MFYFRDQDPGAWGGGVVRSTRLALAYRYRFLPYLYTLFYEVSLEFSMIRT